MNRNVLVVDDEEVCITVLNDLLTHEGYQVYSAKTGEEALTMLKSNDIGVVLLDKNLPGVSGMEILKKIKKDYPSIQIIMVTGYGTKETALEAEMNGAYSYLLKPFDLNVAKTLVRTAFIARDLHAQRTSEKSSAV